MFTDMFIQVKAVSEGIGDVENNLQFYWRRKVMYFGRRIYFIKNLAWEPGLTV